MDDKTNDSNDRTLKPYVKPLLIVHGTLTFLATQAEVASAVIP